MTARRSHDPPRGHDGGPVADDDQAAGEELEGSPAERVAEEGSRFPLGWLRLLAGVCPDLALATAVED